MRTLEEAPRRPVPSTMDPRLTYVVALSAKTKVSLSNSIKQLVFHLEDNDGAVELADLAYTTTSRKYQHSSRVAAAVSSMAQLKQKLIVQADSVERLRPVGKSTPPSVAFAMTGQGASHQSMNL